MANRFLQELKTVFPDLNATLAVDVGANTGKSTRDIHEAFPEAKIYAFEPVLKSFNALKDETGALGRVVPLKFALSNHKGYALMTSNGTSNNNYLLEPGIKVKTQEDVNVIRGDEFFAEEGIEKIDFLRINTSGSEIAALSGFAGLLRVRAIHAIQVTCNFSQGAGSNSSFEKVASFLSPFGYDLFSLNAIGRKSVGDRLPTVVGDAAFVCASPAPSE